MAVFSEIRYSVDGSNDRRKEEDTCAFFVDYLDECERGNFLFFMNGTLMLINIHFKSGQLLIYYINITLYFQF